LFIVTIIVENRGAVANKCQRIGANGSTAVAGTLVFVVGSVAWRQPGTMAIRRGSAFGCFGMTTSSTPLAPCAVTLAASTVSGYVNRGKGTAT